MAGPQVPLPTLRRPTRGGLRTPRGQCGSLFPHRSGLLAGLPAHSELVTDADGRTEHVGLAGCQPIASCIEVDSGLVQGQAGIAGVGGGQIQISTFRSEERRVGKECRL